MADLEFVKARAEIEESPMALIQLGLLLGVLTLIAVVVALTILYFHQGWFRDETHVAIVQAVTGVMIGLPTLIFAVIAGVSSIRAVVASQAQVAAAIAQAEAAFAQVRLAEQQITLSKLQFKEQFRPILDLVRINPDLPWRDAHQEVRFVNVGPGTAINIVPEFSLFQKDGSWKDLGYHDRVQKLTVAPGQRTFVGVLPHCFNGIHVQYQSVNGDRYQSSFFIMPKGVILSSQQDEPTRQLTKKAFSFNTRNTIEFDPYAEERLGYHD